MRRLVLGLGAAAAAGIALSVPLGLLVFRTGERHAKKHGKLKRSG